MESGRESFFGEHFKKIVDNSSDLVVFVDTAGKIIYANKAWKQTLGYNDRKIKQISLEEILPSGLENHSKSFFNKANKGLPVGKVEVVFLSSTGRPVLVEGTIDSLFGRDGEAIGAWGIFRDATEKNLAQQALKESRERLELALVAANDGLWDWDLIEDRIYFDERYFTMAGYEPDEFEHSFREWARRVHPEDVDRCSLAIMDHLEGKAEGFDIEFRFLRKDGTWMWMRGRGKIVNKDRDGTPLRLVGTHSNITERKRAEESLQFQLDYEKAVSEISSYIVGLPGGEIDAGINYALERTARLFQVERGYMFMVSSDGKSMTNTHEWCAPGISSLRYKYQSIPVDLLPWWAERIRAEEYVYIPDVEKLPPEAAAEKSFFQADGICSLLCVPVINNNSLYGFFGFDAVKSKKNWINEHIILLKVIAELIKNALIRHQNEKTIRYLSYHDHLTGLYNRHFMEEEMYRLDTRRQLPISMIMADLNGLKLVNDTYGHSTGDDMLRNVAEILRKSCRSEDIVARWGGDEFVILLPRLDLDEARQICRRISENCLATHVGEIPVSIAQGVASKADINKSLVTTLGEAEDDMYKQKLTESRSNKNAVLQAFLKTLAEKSFETELHTRKMQEAARQIGLNIKLPESELSRLGLLITLHDIGKINVSEEILTKKSLLDEDEWRAIKKHPEIGFKIARATEDFAHIAEEILSHHERWDGKGYPRQLKGKEIPLLSRITAIADAYEVMSCGRPYKKAMTEEEIVAEFQQNAGEQFDPDLVEIFLQIITGKKNLEVF